MREETGAAAGAPRSRGAGANARLIDAEVIIEGALAQLRCGDARSAAEQLAFALAAIVRHLAEAGAR